MLRATQGGTSVSKELRSTGEMQSAPPDPGFLQEQIWTFAPHERSPLPGGAATPEHPLPRRLLYGAIGVLIGLTGTLGTALIAVNLPYLQGSLGAYQDEMAWLPAVYVMTNVPTGMILIKYRQQFGLRAFTLIFLAIYCALSCAHLFVGGMAAAIAVRAASGIAGSALTTLGLNYVIQALPANARLRAIAIGISVPQLSLPLARMLSSGLLAVDHWRSLYLFELGLALISLGAVAAVRLPPAVREQAFEALDFVTTLIFAAALALVCAALAQGRFVWWTDSAWLGWAIAASLPLFGAVFLIEYHRANPLIDMRWLGTVDFLRFVMVGTIARVILSEQTFGAFGLLGVLGSSNDQLVAFSALILTASVAGVVAGALLVGPRRLPQIIVLAIAIVAIAAALDSRATNLTRAPQMYISQVLLAFATTLYIGPAMLIGFARVLADGGTKLTSFIVLFGTTQSLGGLIGTALLGTVQTVREKAHSFTLVQLLRHADPRVELALQQGASQSASRLADPGLRVAQGTASLNQRVSLEANVLAYNDLFLLIAAAAAVTAVVLSLLLLHKHRSARSVASP